MYDEFCCGPPIIIDQPTDIYEIFEKCRSEPVLDLKVGARVLVPTQLIYFQGFHPHWQRTECEVLEVTSISVKLKVGETEGWYDSNIVQDKI